MCRACMGVSKVTGVADLIVPAGMVEQHTHQIADFCARGSCALHTRQPQLHFSGLDVLLAVHSVPTAAAK